jgi:hypothetical protein
MSTLKCQTLFAYLAAFACTAPSAHAQIGSSSLRWQASLDNGQTWQDSEVFVNSLQTEVRLRGLLDWSTDAGFAFARATFDTIIQGGANDITDTIVDARSPFPLNLVFAQTLVTTRFGNLLKIDDSRDTMPPGQGLRGIFPHNPVPAFDTRWTSANPLSIFEFTLVLDGSLGSRTISSIYAQTSQGTPTYPSFYTSMGGATNFTIQTTVVPLTVTVIPAPASMALALGIMCIAGRRRH